MPIRWKNLRERIVSYKASLQTSAEGTRSREQHRRGVAYRHLGSALPPSRSSGRSAGSSDAIIFLQGASEWHLGCRNVARVSGWAGEAKRGTRCTFSVFSSVAPAARSAR